MTTWMKYMKKLHQEKEASKLHHVRSQLNKYFNKMRKMLIQLSQKRKSPIKKVCNNARNRIENDWFHYNVREVNLLLERKVVLRLTVMTYLLSFLMWESRLSYHLRRRRVEAWAGQLKEIRGRMRGRKQ
jgi:hypothetical protein